jgi:hypothetical protein
MTRDPRARLWHSVGFCHEGVVCLFQEATGHPEMDELIRLVARRAGISSAQAALAVSAMLGYLTAGLPSPLVGRIREHLSEAPIPRQPEVLDGSDK